MEQAELTFLTENMGVLIKLGVDMILAILILVAGWVLGNWVSRRIQSLKKLDETLADFLSGLSKYTILIVAIVMMLSEFGVQTASLLAVLGAAGLALGLALQGTLSNVAAGVMLLVLRPFKLGDYITAGGGNIGGTVRSLGLFGTELASPENVYIFIPNSQIWNNNIWNYTRHPHRRQDINVNIAYEDDISRATAVIGGIMAQDPRILQTDDRKPQVVINQLGDFAVSLSARVWCQGSDYWSVRGDLVRQIKEELASNDITIPVTQPQTRDQAA